MTGNAPLVAADAVIPFIFESLPVRGALIQLRSTWARMQRDHDYAEPVRTVLGQAAAATGLIAQSLKFQGSVTLQISGKGPLSMLVMQCTHDLGLRGMATAPAAADDASFASLVAGARCSVIVDTGTAEQPYQGIVDMRPESLAASLENYFARSVQLSSRLVLQANDQLCGGILLQQMPDRGAAREDDWRRLGLLSQTLSLADFELGVGLALLHKVFNEDDVRVFDARPVAFHCRCSRKRAADVLRMLGREESRAVCEERGRVMVTCEYCGRREAFDSVDISRLFAGPSVVGPKTLQ